MPDESLPEDDLDRGLEAGFGRRRERSVLDALGAGASRILLREPPSDAPSPVIKPVPSGSEGRYQVLGEIARGAVGVVFKGHDVDLGRAVAIKVLRSEHSGNAGVVQRFVEEAQVGGQLQHPGIVPVYKMGVRDDGKTPWFAMKLVKGRTLSALLAERKSPADERRRFLGIFEQICQTVAYAHSRGVVHRDLKPANVMIGAFGEVQVVDWGFAKVLAQSGDESGSAAEPAQQSVITTVRSGSTESHSVAGSIFGTPAYMPPEQARGSVDDVDERSDVFSLGAVLCEILTGRPAYAGESARLVMMAAQADLAGAFARLAACGADPQVVRICRACLVPAKEARPRNAGDVAGAVSAYLASEEEKTRAAQLAAAESRAAAGQERAAADAATERAAHARWQRRLTAGVAAAVLVTFAVTGGAWVLFEHGRTERAAEIARDVDAAIGQSVFLRGRAVGRADAAAAHDAIDAAQRAADLAASRDAGGEVRERITAALAETQAEATQARRIAAMIQRAWRGDFREAWTTLRKAVDLYPACSETHHQLANALDFRLQDVHDHRERRRDLAEIEAEYRKAIELDPDGLEARIDFAQHLARGCSDPEVLLAEDEALIRLDPLEPAWLALAFEHNLQCGRLDEAERLARAAADLDPDEPPLAPRLATVRSALDAAKTVLRGEALPDEWRSKQWDVVEACLSARRYATIARLWKAPTFGLTDTNASTQNGMSALRIAALRAGLGEGSDARDASDEERTRFRRLSLGGYTAYVAGLRGVNADDGKTRPWCGRMFNFERQNGSIYPDLPGGFDEEELAVRLPQDEREAWHRYHAEVARIAADPRGAVTIWRATSRAAFARAIVVRRDALPKEYATALRAAQIADAELPGEADVLSVLGAAYYRTGDFANAVETLGRCDAKRSGSESGAQPGDVAFLAMAFQRLGRPEDAAACLARLRELAAKAPHAEDAEAQRFLAEAVEVVEGAATVRGASEK